MAHRHHMHAPRRSLARVLSALTAGSLTMLGAAAVPATAHASAARPASPAATHGTAGHAPMSAAAAAVRARAMRKPVVAAALTTQTSQTVAEPNGTFTVTQSMLPVRAWQGGRWQRLDAALRRQKPGRLAPAVAANGLSLSGGGSTTPLAVMTAHGRTLQVWWPGRLPAPQVSGATATYADVYPGVSLTVTATPQGGFSDVLIIKDAAAAASPALRRIRMQVTSSAGLHLRAAAGGSVNDAEGRAAAPVFTIEPTRMWDSARPAPGTRLATGPGGTAVTEPGGLQAYSTPAAPGAAAHVTAVPVTVAGTTITLAPPARALTGPGITYPVDIDPGWIDDPYGNNAANWTQIQSGDPGESYWHESGDLQLGDCDFDTCNGIGLVYPFILMNLPSGLPTTTYVDSSQLTLDNVASYSCTAEPVQLWTTSKISSSTDYDNASPADAPGFWKNHLTPDQSFAWGYPGCQPGGLQVSWPVTSTVQSDITSKATQQSFGFQPGSTISDLDWKQFLSGASNITLSTNYHTPPAQPASLENDPAGACNSTSSGANETQMGNNDITLKAFVSDIDGNDGDTSLTTKFTLETSTGTVVSGFPVSVASGNGTKSSAGATVQTTIPRTQFTSVYHGTGGATTAYSYKWFATTSDAGDPTGQHVLTSPTSQTCYFNFNPVLPAAPDVAFTPASGPVGTSASVEFSPAQTCTGSTCTLDCTANNTCPTQYTYQVGVAPPVVETHLTNDDWTGTIPISQFGDEQVIVTATDAAGTIGTPATVTVEGTLPNTAYQDGYFTGGTYPSLLTLGTGTDPSLWLSAGSGPGTLSPPIDIGSIGTFIGSGSGDGPADWKGTQVLHGDFTGHELQDVMAYYPTSSRPTAGTGEIIGGPGNASSLVPYSGNQWTVSSSALTDPFYANSSDVATELTAAGDASEDGPAVADLIGVLGDPTSAADGSPYELDLFSVSGTCGVGLGGNSIGQYGYCTTLSTTAPDGTTDWQNYTLATAEIGNSPANIALFALNTTTGSIYETTNPNALNSQLAATTPVGSGTWTQLTGGPTGTFQLASADVSNAGVIELWTVSGGNATAYTLAAGSTTLTQEASAQSLAKTTNDWQLTDGSPLAQGPAITTATDAIQATTASLTGTCGWPGDFFFSTVLQADGSTCYLTPPAGTAPSGDPSPGPEISVWFKTAPQALNGVLVSMQQDPLSSGATTTGGYDPVMYIGSNGKVYAEWWDGSAKNPAVSNYAENDGHWHHAVLEETSPTTETLYIDGQPQTTTTTGTISLTSPDFNIGAGYIGGGWPNEEYSSTNNNNGTIMYFNGDIADVTLNK